MVKYMNTEVFQSNFKVWLVYENWVFRQNFQLVNVFFKGSQHYGTEVTL